MVVPAVLCEDCGDDRRCVGSGRSIRLVSGNLPARCAHRRHKFIRDGNGALVRESNRCAVGCKPFDDRPTNASGPAGDKRHLVL